MKSSSISWAIRLALALALSSTLDVRAGEPEEATLTAVGQPAPGFTLTTLDGKEVSSAQLRGKVVVLNFFATWCGPCMQEMPHLEEDVWQRFKDKGLVLVAVGREHSNDELIKFRKEKRLTLPVAADPKREVYDKFASKFIPRTYVIDANGRIAFQSAGYEPAEFRKLVETIGRELGKAR